MSELNCQRCHLHKVRKNVVPGRGDKPAEILFIGEAPGKSEDVRGLSFVGPAGRILTQAMSTACKISDISIINMPTCYFTNVVRCIPKDSKESKWREPTEEEAWACRVWLERTYLEVNPQRVVFLGRVAERYCRKMYPDAPYIFHPSFVERKGGVESTEFITLARDLSSVFKEVINGRKKETD